MKTVQISLNSIGKVKSFVNAITQFDFDFDLIFLKGSKGLKLGVQL